MNLDDSLLLMQRFPRLLARHWKERETRPETLLSNFLGLAEALQPEATLQVPQTVDREAARQAWAKAQNRLNGLSRGELAVLCTDPDIATDPKFLKGFAEHPRLPGRMRCVMALIACYFDRWRKMPDPNGMERLLKDVVGRGQMWGKTFRRYQDNAEELFSPNAALTLASPVVSARESISEELDRWGVPPTGGLACGVAREAARLWIENWRSLPASASEEVRREHLEYAIATILTDERTGPAYYSCMTRLIEDPAITASEQLRRMISQHVLASPRLGDPRLPMNGPNWREAGAEARRTVLAWLAEESIKFFFDFVLPKGKDRHGRKSFWLQYGRAITDFQVALSSDDEYRLRSSVRDMPKYSRAVGGNTSAFLLKFASYRGEIVVVEFSKVGNAAYVYEAPAFEARLHTIREPQYGVDFDLKHDDAIDRILHASSREGWRNKAARLLARLGVYPS